MQKCCSKANINRAIGNKNLDCDQNNLTKILVNKYRVICNVFLSANCKRICGFRNLLTKKARKEETGKRKEKTASYQ